MKMNLKTLLSFLFLSFLIFSSLYGEEKPNKIKEPHKFNFYSGMFDTGDSVGESSMIGIQHQNENLYRDTFLGTISPVTGFLMTGDNSTYLYTGIKADYKIGYLNFIPSFTPGLYGKGGGKDLGHIIEFKSELQMSLDLPKNTEFGFSYNHVSNAGFGDKNPGANSYMFNFFKNF